MLFIPLSVDRHSAFPHFLAMINKAAMSIHVQGFVWPCFHVSRLYTEEGNCKVIGWLCLMSRCCWTALRSGCTLSFAQRAWGLQALPSSSVSALTVVCLRDGGRSRGCEVRPLWMSWACPWRLAGMLKCSKHNLCTFLLAILIASLQKRLFCRFSTHFQWVVLLSPYRKRFWVSVSCRSLNLQIFAVILWSSFSLSWCCPLKHFNEIQIVYLSLCCLCFWCRI